LLVALFIPPQADTFGPHTRCAWALVDGAGAVLRSGHDALEGIPRANKIWVVLPASRVLFTELALPPVSASRLATLLPFAVEDKLMSDPGTIHAVVAPRGASAKSERVVAVVDKPWLSGVLEVLAAQHFVPDAVIPESELTLREAGVWTVVLQESGGYLARDDAFAVAFDYRAGQGVPLAVELALKEAAKRNEAPQRVRLLAHGGEPDSVDSAAWSERLGVTVERVDPPVFGAAVSRVAENKTSRVDFLTGAIARQFAHQTGWREYARLARPTLLIAAAILGLHIAFTAADWWRLERERDALEAEMVATFKAAFPEARAIVDPALQMRRNTEALRRERGLAGDDEMVSLLAAAASLVESSSGIRARAVQFSAQRLAVDLEADSSADLQRLGERRGAGSYAAHLGPIEQAEGKQRARLMLEAGQPGVGSHGDLATAAAPVALEQRISK
jgi:general secretion pathway protein L